MVNSRAKGMWQLLDKHEATGTEASYIYTPSTALLERDFSEFIILIHGAATAALELQLIVNSLETSKYFADGTEMVTGTETLIDIGAEEYYPFLPASLISGALQFHAKIHIYLATAGMPNDQVMLSSVSRAQISGGNQLTGVIDENFNTLTEIEIQTSTSTWIAGTTIVIYGIRK